MEGWLEEGRQGILNTEPPPSPTYPEVEGNLAVAEVTLTEAPEQPPPTHVEEEAIASNPSSTPEELANEVTYGFTGNHVLINLEVGQELASTINNDLPLAD